MRVLILGAAGMLGHKLWQHLREELECFSTVRRARSEYRHQPLLQDTRIRYNVDLRVPGLLEDLLSEISPDVVINCVGIVKQLREAQDAEMSIELNALLPHRLQRLCKSRGSRLVHFSTDCVFSGRRGNYAENDVQPDYGSERGISEALPLLSAGFR